MKVILVIVIMMFWTTTCYGQRIQGNGRGGEERNMVQSGGRRRNSGPCLPEEYLGTVQSSFQNLIPTFNARSFSILLLTSSKY